MKCPMPSDLFEVKPRDSIVLLLSKFMILKGPCIVASRQSSEHWNIYWNIGPFWGGERGMMGKSISAWLKAVIESI